MIRGLSIDTLLISTFTKQIDESGFNPRRHILAYYLLATSRRRVLTRRTLASTYPSADKKLPTIVLGNGYDGSIEEMHHQYGAGILERGWNALCYDGPGQILGNGRLPCSGLPGNSSNRQYENYLPPALLLSPTPLLRYLPVTC
ncbi:hypothetical protein CCUS01_00891 [Colletotrichum cuscutae]|uniref:Uncharacterized protein n=1 Tax=Colletotrichum cuscutae TaxID=1209917 RepID=A0AAI9Y327_9PEZI|nr:hypothetical protein CCUS01_00891 [Colletotrichum cuscutae]